MGSHSHITGQAGQGGYLRAATGAVGKKTRKRSKTRLVASKAYEAATFSHVVEVVHVGDEYLCLLMPQLILHFTPSIQKPLTTYNMKLSFALSALLATTASAAVLRGVAADRALAVFRNSDGSTGTENSWCEAGGQQFSPCSAVAGEYYNGNLVTGSGSSSSWQSGSHSSGGSRSSGGYITTGIRGNSNSGSNGVQCTKATWEATCNGRGGRFQGYTISSNDPRGQTGSHPGMCFCY